MEFLLNQDVWQTIIQHMFENEKSSTYSCYIDGTAAVQRGYTELIRCVASRTYPKEKPCYFYLDDNIIEIPANTSKTDSISDLPDMCITYTNLDKIRRYFSRDSETYRDYTAQLISESIAHSEQTDSDGDEVREPTCQNLFEDIEQAVSNRNLSRIHKLREVVKGSSIREKVIEMLYTIELGKLWLPFIRYFYHYDLGKLCLIRLGEMFIENVKTGPSKDQQDTLFRVLTLSTWAYCQKVYLSPHVTPDHRLWDDSLDQKIIETNRYFYMKYPNHCFLDYISLQSYLVLRFCEGHIHLWEHIRDGIFYGKKMTLINSRAGYVPVLNDECRRTIEACLKYGNELVLENMRRDIITVLEEKFTSQRDTKKDRKKVIDRWMYQIINRKTGLYRDILQRLSVFHWFKENEPTWIYSENE